jgi:hypothetical protein
MKNKLLKVLILPIIGISLFSCNNTTSSVASSNSQASSENSSIEETTSFTNPITVTFKDYDSKTIYTITIESGSMPYYDAYTPTRESDENFSYTFAGWDRPFTELTKNTVYTAQYNKTVINDTYSTDGVNYTLSEDGTYYIASSFDPYTSGVIKSISEIVVAKTYDGKPVKEIGMNFCNPSQPFALEIVYLPDSITTINSNAFAYLNDFKQIILSKNVTTIKTNAFNNCPNLCIYSYAEEKPSTWEDGYADKDVKTYFASQWEMINAGPLLK